MMPPFKFVCPTNKIAHFVEVSLYFILSSTTSLYSENYIYRDIKEKVIGKTCKYTPGIEESLKDLILGNAKSKGYLEGLRISQEEALCHQYMGQFPVISISLKGVDGLTFESACTLLKGIIGREALRFQFLKQSGQLSQEEKEIYQQLIRIDEKNREVYAMSEGILIQSLQNIMKM